MVSTCARGAGAVSILALLFGLASCGRIGFDSLSSDPDGATPAVDAVAPAVDTLAIDRRLSCEKEADSADVALYRFDNDSLGNIVDAVGTNSAGTVGTVTYVEGPNPACGRAIQFTASQGYGLIPDDAAWQLNEGAIDFWFRADAFPGTLAGLLSRDGSGTATPGHLGVYLDSTGRVGFRIQEMDQVDTFEGGVCSEAGTVALDEWNHLGLNFGNLGPELWLNGEVVNAPGMLSTVVCQTGNAIGITGNTNPWTIGINSGGSDDGTALPVTQPFDGAMDHLRISSERRDFSGPAYDQPTP